MNLEQRYKYFIARLAHEVKKRGHGGLAEIGNAIGLKGGGAYIGQILKPNSSKRASDKIQAKIADYICGNEERFIDEGMQIENFGYIKSEITKATQPSDPSPNILDGRIAVYGSCSTIETALQERI